jgi:hypothetical protein
MAAANANKPPGTTAAPKKASLKDFAGGVTGGSATGGGGFSGGGGDMAFDEEDVEIHVYIEPVGPGDH